MFLSHVVQFSNRVDGTLIISSSCVCLGYVRRQGRGVEGVDLDRRRVGE